MERLWEEFKLKASADARERLILHYSPLVKYVAGRVGVGLPPNIEQADLVSYGIFGLIDAIEKFDLERAHQVRDLRDQPDPRRDHRRAARHRLDPALGPVQGPRGREGLRRARGRAAPHADRGRGRRSRWASPLERPAPIFSQVSFVNVVALDELLSVGGEKGDKLSLVDTLEDTRPRTRSRPSSPRRRSSCWPARSTRCRSGRRSSSPSTTTRASPWPRSARCSASPSARDLPDAHQGRAPAPGQDAGRALTASRRVGRGARGGRPDHGPRPPSGVTPAQCCVG